MKNDEFCNKIYGKDIVDLLYHIRHGMRIPCPTCFEPGRLDLRPDRTPQWEDSIWYNCKLNQWECHDCWLK